MSWTPRRRPEWVEALNGIGASSRDARRLVSLEPSELIQAATDSTGLHDFGPDDWREPFEVLLTSLESEAELHTVGRLLARSEIVRALANRLVVIDGHHRTPELSERPVRSPVLVTGTGRSGTSLLLELLACDQGFRSPRTWEMLYPETVHDRASQERGRRDAHQEVTFWNLVTPEYQSMHDNGGDHPNECIFMTKPTFVSDHWMGTFPTPAYARWLARADRSASFAFHRMFLQFLQGSTQPRWLLKAPSHLSQLIPFFAAYPDAQVIITHRDPLRVLGSITDLMATLQWQKSDIVDYPSIVRSVEFGTAIVFDLLEQWRADGTLPDDQIHDVRYSDLVRDPIAVTRSLYADMGLELTEGTERSMRDYLEERRAVRATLSSHDYSFRDTGLDYSVTRSRFARYMSRFDLPVEEQP